MRAGDVLQGAARRELRARRSGDAIGDRAEEIVRLSETRRLQELGLDPGQHLRWASAENEQADHDFDSVDENGQPMVIEVKAASPHGSFRWTRKEFLLAIRERGRYWLYVVLGATGRWPVIVRYRDRVGLWQAGEIELDFADLQGRAPLPSGLSARQLPQVPQAGDRPL